MQIDKQQIINLLREQGEHGKADEAEKQLPDKVDHDEHKGLLDQVGVDPQKLLNRF